MTSSAFIDERSRKELSDLQRLLTEETKQKGTAVQNRKKAEERAAKAEDEARQLSVKLAEVGRDLTEARISAESSSGFESRMREAEHALIDMRARAERA